MLLPLGVVVSACNFIMEGRGTESKQSFFSITGHVEICRAITEHNVKKNPVDNFGNTPYLQGAYGGHLEICKLTIDENTVVNPFLVDFTLPYGTTWLHHFAKNGHYEFCRFIIKHASDKNPADR